MHACLAWRIWQDIIVNFRQLMQNYSHDGRSAALAVRRDEGSASCTLAKAAASHSRHIGRLVGAAALLLAGTVHDVAVGLLNCTPGHRHRHEHGVHIGLADGLAVQVDGPAHKHW